MRAYLTYVFRFRAHPASVFLQERVFSLCFSATGGTMVIGGFDPRLNKPGSEMQYTPSNDERTAPRVEVSSSSTPSLPGCCNLLSTCVECLSVECGAQSALEAVCFIEIIWTLPGLKEDGPT